MYGFYYSGDALYWLAILAVMVVTIWAQVQVSHNFNVYSQIRNRRGISGAQAAEAVLRAHGVNDVGIEYVDGRLTDHYDPRDNTIYLSREVYYSTSIASVGVASHEAGHAVQYAEGYTPVRIRSAIIPAAKIGWQFSFILILVGIFLYSQTWFGVGVILFAITTFFQLMTLPVEFNASSRALATISGQQLLDEDELVGARKVLRAAALTYVAALLTSLVQLLRFAAIFASMGGRGNGGGGNGGGGR
jgi:Zn-dependent membrane protease YugP